MTQMNMYDVLKKFLTRELTIEDVNEYLRSNPRAKFLFSFHNISALFYNSPVIMYLFNKHLNHVFYSNEFKSNPNSELEIISNTLESFQVNPYQLGRQGKYINQANNKALDNYITYRALELFYGDRIDSAELSFIKLLYDYNVLNNERVYEMINELKEYAREQIQGNSKKRNKKQLLNKYKDTGIDVSKLLEEIEQIKNEYNSRVEQTTENTNTIDYCKQCPLSKYKLSRVDKEIFQPTNSDNIDVFIIGLNPGKDEVIQNRPFIGKSGQLLRKYLQQYFEQNNISYLITNVIQCHTNNETELKQLLNECNITKPDEIPCNYFVDYVKQYNPKYILVFGKSAAKVVNAKLPEYRDRIIELKHPSYYIRKGIQQPDEYEQTFRAIVKNIKGNNMSDAQETHTDNNKDEDNNNQSELTFNKCVIEIDDITEIPKNNLLVDIDILENENKFLIVTTDENGIKYYYLMPFRTDIFVNLEGQESPRYNPHIANYNKLTRVTIDDYLWYEKLKRALKKKYRELFEI
jgi:uracil-DNA glycosylase family 4